MLYLVTMKIPSKYYTNLVSSRLIGGNTSEHELHCGFLCKNGYQKVETLFPNFGGLLVLDGTGMYEDAIVGTSAVGPGDWVQRMPGVEHISTINEGIWLECFIVFGGRLFEVLTELGLVSNTRPVLSTGLDLSLIKRFFAFQEELSRAKDSELFRCLITAQSLLASVYEQAGNGTSREQRIADQACWLLGEQLGERLSTEELLQGMGLSYERIRKLFMKQIGVSPHAYRIRRRLDRACELLREGKASVSEIAERLGYADPFTFSRQFTKERGTSPSAYRKQI